MLLISISILQVSYEMQADHKLQNTGCRKDLWGLKILFYFLLYT